MLLSCIFRLYCTNTDRTFFFQSFNANPNSLLNRNPFSSFYVTFANRNAHELFVLLSFFAVRTKTRKTTYFIMKRGKREMAAIAIEIHSTFTVLKTLLEN
jgi:hypothetical protein